AISTSGPRMNSMAFSRIPYATEQGISKRVIRELFRGTANFNSLISGVYAAPKLGIGTCGGWRAQADSHRFRRAVRSWRGCVSGGWGFPGLAWGVTTRPDRPPRPHELPGRVDPQGRGARRCRLLRYLPYR